MKHLLSIIAISFINLCYGQQEYSFTNYFEINSFFNPAATGTEGTQNITGLFRKQWVGFEGSPMTGGINYENSLTKEKIGLGGYVFTDVIGAVNMTNVAVNYSYSLKLNETNFLSFGVDAGADFYSTDYDRLIYWDNDDMFDNQQNNKVLPRAGLGIHYYSDQLYVGLSVPRLLSFNNTTTLGISSQNYPSTMSNYFFTAGYNYPLNANFELQANVLGKYTPHVMPQGDINLMATYREIVGLGAGYKTLGFASVYVQYTYDSVVKIVYAFDMSLTKIANYSSGSHEIVIKYTIQKKRDKSSI